MNHTAEHDPLAGVLNIHQRLLRRSKQPWTLGQLHPRTARPDQSLFPDLAPCQPYQSVLSQALAPLRGRQRLDELPGTQLDPLLLAVVRAEGPVHLDVLIARLLAEVVRSRSSARLQHRILTRLNELAAAGVLEQCGHFSALPHQLRTPPYRDWRAQTERLRRLEYVHDRELMQAIWRVVDASPDLSVDQAMNDGLHAIGFIRLTANARERAEGPLQALLQSGLLAPHGDRLIPGPWSFVR